MFWSILLGGMAVTVVVVIYVGIVVLAWHLSEIFDNIALSLLTFVATLGTGFTIFTAVLYLLGEFV